MHIVGHIVPIGMAIGIRISIGMPIGKAIGIRIARTVSIGVAIDRSTASFVDRPVAPKAVLMIIDLRGQHGQPVHNVLIHRPLTHQPPNAAALHHLEILRISLHSVIQIARPFVL